MQPSIAGFACHGYLLAVLSILTLALASQLSNEEPFGSEVTERPNTEPPSTMVKRPLPNEMWRLVLEKCELTGYLQFLLAYPEMQSLRLTEAVEFDLLEKAFQELEQIELSPRKLDYGRHESIVASIREFIKFSSRRFLAEGEAVTGADNEISKIVVRLADNFRGDSPYSLVARGILFSALIEHLHEADISMNIFAKYRRDILYAAAVKGNYEQLKAFVDKSELGWTKAASLVAPAIARSGSIELFEKVLQVSCLQAMGFSFWIDVIKFNKKELFLELARQLEPGIDEKDLTRLWNIFQACCWHERQELVQVLIEHHSEHLLRINLKASFLVVIGNGAMDIFTMLLGSSAFPSLLKSSTLDYYQLLYTIICHRDRADMVRHVLSLGGIDESVLVEAFSSAVTQGNIKVMELLLGTRPDGCTWMSTLFLINDQVVDNIGQSGRADVIEFFLRKRDGGDARFDGFSVGMKENAILCSACSRGRYELVKYLLRRHEEANEFIFPDVNPAARNNEPLLNAIHHRKILKELLRQEQDGAMYYRDVAVPDKVLLRAAKGPYRQNFELLLQTVKHDDGSIRFKFPIIDINFNNHEMLEYLVSRGLIIRLNFLFRRDPDSGDFLLPGLHVPERFADRLDALKVLWRP